MAAYERFLSYLFEYDQDTKGANCGFAKIEVRGETKRIQITIKGRTQVELLHVCAFYRENEKCVCIPLGRMMVNGGNGQFQYVSSGIYLSGSQVMFSQVKGLVLSNPQLPGQAYATVWDDEPFGLSMFEPEAEEEIQAMEMAIPGMWRSGEEAGFLEPGQIVVIRREEMEPEKEAVQAAEPIEPAEKCTEYDEAVVSEAQDDAEMEAVTDMESENAAAAELESISKQDEDEKDTDSAANTDGTESTDCAGGSRQIEEPWNPAEAEIFWAGLCRRFPRIETLAGDEMVCLRAVPADIGRLPRPNWIFGNNGFLMYSYVRYRYIVFARVAKEAFELWLPGTYGKNEEVLARMFGFEQFRSMKSMDAADGDFGYWCVPIIVPQVRMGQHG